MLLQFLLLAIFLHFFGVPAIEKYRKAEVMVVETSRQNRIGIPLPAITIGIVHDAAMDKELNNFCFALNESVAECILKKTPTLSGILKGVLLGYENTKSLALKEDQIIEDFTVSASGRHFTLNLSLHIGPDDFKHQLFIALGNSSQVKIFLHDPNYFIFNDNPVGLPTAMALVDPIKMSSHYHRIAQKLQLILLLIF